MIVALYFPHNEGSVTAVVTGPGFDSESVLVDGYEVDATMKSFSSEEELAEWLEDHTDEGDPPFEEVTGGLLRVVSYDES